MVEEWRGFGYKEFEEKDRIKDDFWFLNLDEWKKMMVVLIDIGKFTKGY